MKLSKISWVILFLTNIGIIFYSSWFFLGDEEAFNELKAELIKNILLRSLTFSIIGLPTVVLISIIEFIRLKRKNGNYKLLPRKVILVSLLVISFALIGSTIFFLN